jgi:hypothetical protein
MSRRHVIYILFSYPTPKACVFFLSCP